MAGADLFGGAAEEAGAAPEAWGGIGLKARFGADGPGAELLAAVDSTGAGLIRRNCVLEGEVGGRVPAGWEDEAEAAGWEGVGAWSVADEAAWLAMGWLGAAAVGCDALAPLGWLPEAAGASPETSRALPFCLAPAAAPTLVADGPELTATNVTLSLESLSDTTRRAGIDLRLVSALVGALAAGAAASDAVAMDERRVLPAVAWRRIFLSAPPEVAPAADGAGSDSAGKEQQAVKPALSPLPGPVKRREARTSLAFLALGRRAGRAGRRRLVAAGARLAPVVDLLLAGLLGVPLGEQRVVAVLARLPGRRVRVAVVVDASEGQRGRATDRSATRSAAAGRLRALRRWMGRQATHTQET